MGDERVGVVKIGGDAPVSVQTMTAGYTYDVDNCVAEINRLAAAGADIVRVAVPNKKDTEALRDILPQVRVPIVADVHFHFGRALEAVDAFVLDGERFAERTVTTCQGETRDDAADCDQGQCSGKHEQEQIVGGDGVHA